MKILKISQRNKMGYKLLNAILTFRAGLNTVGKNCHVYVFPENFWKTHEILCSKLRVN